MGLNKEIEKILFNQVREGEEASFEILFNYYYARLCAYALIFVKYPDMAEDIVQEILIRIWEKREEISIETTFKAYIYRSVHNKCINYLKSKKYQDRQNETIRKEMSKQTEINIKNLDTEIIDNIISEEFSFQFKRTIESLPPQCREVFILCRNEKLSYTEAAKKLDVSVNTVKTQMKRALAKLRESLEKNFGK